MKRRIIGGVLAGTAAIALLAGCTGSDPAPSSSDSSSANVYLYQAPVSFNPFHPAAGAEQLTESLVYDNLVTTGENFDFTPQLAESWDISPDATTYTFHLQEGMKWSDGTPFTSADVVFSYNLYANPAVEAATTSSLSGVAGYDDFQSGAATSLSGVTAPDDNTVVFTLSTPNAGFLALIGVGTAFAILPEHILGDEDPAGLQTNAFFDLPPVGMGPYVMDAFNVGQDVELSANPNYRTPVGVDKLYLKILTSDVATSQLATGELDLSQVTALDLATVQDVPGVTVTSAPSPGFTRLSINTTKPYLSDKRVRQALLYAIDRQGIIDGVYDGNATPVNSSFMTSWALPDDLNTYDYDPEKAKSLLSEAGFDFNQSISISWVPGRADRDQMVNIIVENLTAVGIKAEALQVDDGTDTQGFTDKTYDLDLFGGGVYPPDPVTTTGIVSCATVFPAGGNVSYFCNEELDALMAQGAVLGDQAQREPIYQDAARIDNDFVPYLWLNNASTNWATSNKLQGFINNGDPFNAFWNAADWTIGG